jgi:hypothetical protein
MRTAQVKLKTYPLERAGFIEAAACFFWSLRCAQSTYILHSLYFASLSDSVFTCFNSLYSFCETEIGPACIDSWWSRFSRGHSDSNCGWVFFWLHLITQLESSDAHWVMRWRSKEPTWRIESSVSSSGIQKSWALRGREFLRLWID